MKQKIKISKEDKQKAEEIAEDNRWVYYKGEPLGDLTSTSSKKECYQSAIDMAKHKNQDFNNFLNVLLMQSNMGQIYTLIEEKLKNL